MTATATLTATALQLRAAHVLTTLLSQDLPPVNWAISPFVDQPELNGQINSYHRPLADLRADIAAWAEALGVPSTLRRMQTPRPDFAASLRVLATVNGVQVEVWAAITVEDLAELDAEPVPAVSGG